ncbi:hypothetical protein HDE_06622 [Halotydeus destructor]|nr:hypothetical protein HDE_06622 [Halotydeus destructor]
MYMSRIQNMSGPIYLKMNHERPVEPRAPLFTCPSWTRQRMPVTIMMICLCGAAYQCYDVTSEYIKYEVVSDLSISKQNYIVPPAFTLCLVYVDLIDWRTLLAGYKFDTEPPEPREVIKALQETVSIAKILEALPNVTGKQILKYMMAREQGTYDILENEKAIKIERFIKNYYVCYMFTMLGGKDGGNVRHESKDISYGREPGTLMRISFAKANLSSVSRAVFYLSPANYLPRGDRDFRLSIDARGQNVFSQSATYWSLSYQKVALRLLPAPYVTNCRDFESMGFEGSYHCQLSCTHAHAMKKFGKSLFTILYTKPENFTVINKYSIIGNETLRKQIDEIETLCDRKCEGETCHQRLFAPRIESQLSHQTEIVFRIVESSGVFIGSEAKAQMSWMNYTVSVLSILGVWLSFSFVSVIQQMYHVSTLILGRLSQRRNSNLGRRSFTRRFTVTEHKVNVLQV